MKITKTSTLTGAVNTMDLPITEEQIYWWKNGDLIQDAMPHLTPAQREFLMTGTTQEEWDVAFKEDDGVNASDCPGCGEPKNCCDCPYDYLSREDMEAQDFHDACGDR